MECRSGRGTAERGGEGGTLRVMMMKRARGAHSMVSFK